MKEEIIYSTKLHWTANIIPIVFIFLGVISIIWIALSLTIGYGLSLFDLAGFGFVFLAFKGVYKLFLNRSVKINLSQNRLSLESGVFSKEISDISLQKYEGMSITQSLIGKMLNYGNLTITTGGVSHNYTITNPLQLRSEINQLI